MSRSGNDLGTNSSSSAFHVSPGCNLLQSSRYHLGESASVCQACTQSRGQLVQRVVVLDPDPGKVLDPALEPPRRVVQEHLAPLRRREVVGGPSERMRPRNGEPLPPEGCEKAEVVACFGEGDEGRVDRGFSDRERWPGCWTRLGAIDGGRSHGDRGERRGCVRAA